MRVSGHSRSRGTPLCRLFLSFVATSDFDCAGCGSVTITTLHSSSPNDFAISFTVPAFVTVTSASSSASLLGAIVLLPIVTSCLVFAVFRCCVHPHHFDTSAHVFVSPPLT